MSTTAAAAAPASSPAPPHDTTTAPATGTAQIHTYHCLCTQLLLASTTPLSLLPRRRSSSGSEDDHDDDNDDNTSSSLRDRAYILPLPASPPAPTPAPRDANANTTSNADADADADAAAPHYALTFSLTLLPGRSGSGQTVVVVQRPHGLEKRYLARCARCRVVVGYWLDWSQFSEAAAAAHGSNSNSNSARTGRRDDVVYVLPGGLLSTEDMAAGKRGQGAARKVA